MLSTLAAFALVFAPTDAMAMDVQANAASVSTTTTTVSTTITSTTTTTLTPYWSSVLLGVFPTEPIHALELQIDVDRLHADPVCEYLIGGPGNTFSLGYIERHYDAPWNADGFLMRSQALLECAYRTEADDGPSSLENYVLKFVHAWINLDWVHRKPVTTRICVLAFDPEGNSSQHAGCRFACGDAICDGGEPTVLDALIVLRSGVALSDCPALLCDTDSDGTVSASDALRVLRRAIGLAQPLLCPPPEHCLTPQQ
jgi:hypothetical protein